MKTNKRQMAIEPIFYCFIIWVEKDGIAPATSLYIHRQSSAHTQSFCSLFLPNDPESQRDSPLVCNGWWPHCYCAVVTYSHVFPESLLLESKTAARAVPRHVGRTKALMALYCNFFAAQYNISK